MFALSEGEIDVCAVENAVRHSGAGAVLTFRGDTRVDFEGREVVRLEECLEDIFAPLAFDEKSALQELLNQLRDTLKGEEADDALTHELSLRA